jgi:REP element-mobilizing transposase RayT
LLFVTWRLADSLPEEIVGKILRQRKEWMEDHPTPWDEVALKEYNRLFTLRLEGVLDDCHGSCCLREKGIGKVVAAALHHFDGERYFLDRYVIMPNHVHVLFSLAGNAKMEDVLHSWQRFTAREINKLLGRAGQLWHDEYWDRLIRSQKHLDWTRQYIERNPEKLAPGTFHLWTKE